MSYIVRETMKKPFHSSQSSLLHGPGERTMLRWCWDKLVPLSKPESLSNYVTLGSSLPYSGHVLSREIKHCCIVTEIQQLPHYPSIPRSTCLIQILSSSFITIILFISISLISITVLSLFYVMNCALFIFYNTLNVN